MKKVLAYIIAPFVTLMGFINQAMAALPDGVSTAVSTAQADGIELGGMLLGLAVAVGVIFWLRRRV